jgi:hypothetical protein
MSKWNQRKPCDGTVSNHLASRGRPVGRSNPFSVAGWAHRATTGICSSTGQINDWSEGTARRRATPCSQWRCFDADGFDGHTAAWNPQRVMEFVADSSWSRRQRGGGVGFLSAEACSGTYLFGPPSTAAQHDNKSTDLPIHPNGPPRKNWVIQESGWPRKSSGSCGVMVVKLDFCCSG